MKKTALTAVSIAALLTVLSLLFSCGKSDASIPEQSKIFYVYDETGVIDEELAEYVTAKNVDLYEKCGGQIVVVCVKTTGNLDIRDYAYSVFNKWKIGSVEKNNGVLILMSIDEDDYWVLQGAGLESVLQSGTLKLMLDDHLEPHFAKKEYGEGVRELFDALIKEYENIYSIEVVAQSVDPGDYQASPLPEQVKPGFMQTVWNVISGIAYVVVIGNLIFIAVVVAIIIFLIIAILINSELGGVSSGSSGSFRPSTHHNYGGIHINTGGFRPSGTFRTGSSGGFRTGSSGGFRTGSSGGFKSSGGFRGSGGGGFSRGGGAGRR